jgi:hypothetical protein
LILELEGHLMPVFNRRHFAAAAAAAFAVTFTATASAQLRLAPATSEVGSKVSLRMESPERMMGQYPPQIRKYLLQNLHIGMTQPKTDLETRTMFVLHAVRIERGRLVDSFASRAFSLPSGQSQIPGDMFMPSDKFIPGDMFMPGEIFAPGSAAYPATGQAGAVRESAQRFANSQRITDLSFWVVLPVGTAATAQGVRF